MKSAYLILFTMFIFGSLQNCKGCKKSSGGRCDGRGEEKHIPYVTGCECDTDAIVKHHDGRVTGGNCLTKLRGKFFCYVNKKECGEANTGRFKNKWINYSLCDCQKYPDSSACKDKQTSKFGEEKTN